MEKRISFVLAGCSGSGKSTLLHKAFEQKLPIIGNELNEVFQAVNPMCFPERHNFQKALQEKSIFQAKHIPKLLALAASPSIASFTLTYSTCLSDGRTILSSCTTCWTI